MNFLTKKLSAMEKKRILCEDKIAELIRHIQKYPLLQEESPLTCIGVCTNSNLFRGVYHPSPMHDLIVGGTKRGRFIQQDAMSDNVSHRYFLNQQKQLVRIEKYNHQKNSYIEHLFYDKNVRIGITADQENRIYGISEEIFENKQILSFAYLSYFEIDQNDFLGHLQWEEFKYNENGIFSCDFIPDFIPGTRLFAFSNYHVESQNGLIKNYISENGTVYPVKKKRDSFGRGHYLGENKA